MLISVNYGLWHPSLAYCQPGPMWKGAKDELKLKSEIAYLVSFNKMFDWGKHTAYDHREVFTCVYFNKICNLHSHVFHFV